MIGVALALALVALPPGSRPLELDGAPGVWTSTTTWARIERRIAASDRSRAAARERLDLQAAELAILRAATATCSSALADGEAAARALGVCLADEARAVEALASCESGRLGPVELAAGAGGAVVAGALLGGLVCWGAR